MEHLGKINNREIYYLAIRSNSYWYKLLPNDNWIAFTIADKEDKELLNSSTIACLDKNVAYTCSAGELGSLTEEYFDEEITWRAIQYEKLTGSKFDYEYAPMTTMHQNFSEGFWFATTLADNDLKEIDKVVCVDFTKQKVKDYLTELIEKIDNGWLPSDKKNELVKYDK